VLFNSPEFLIFAVVVISTYVMARHSLLLQNGILVIASYAFYAFWDYRFLVLIWVSTFVDFAMGQAMQRWPTRRRWWLAISLGVNLGILGFFKYFNFFVGSAADALIELGFQANVPTLNIILPVGISFYTFQTLAYTIDVYRGKFAPERNLLNFALYVCYFPQLVAGPIERAQQLLPAIRTPRMLNMANFWSGLTLCLVGFFKKLAIADVVAIFVDQGFAAPEQYSSFELVCIAYLFAFQIYADFSAYSDIARGVSRMMGIELMRNFESPYFSRNIQDFWRRWHISLSTWLRDYLYISLGGNRLGAVRTYINLMVTMILGGIWHGANWTFVIWGVIHGGVLAFHRRFMAGKQTVSQGWWQPAVSMLATFHIVVLAWIFFRADSLEDSVDYFHYMLQLNGGIGDFVPPVVTSLVLLLMVDIPQHRSKRHDFLLYWQPLPRALWVGMMLFAMLTIGAQQAYEVPFIYFQF